MSVTEGRSPSTPLHSGAGDGPDADTLLPIVREATAGDYEIIGELGRGGMAAVYLANDVALNRKVAIKTMLPELIARHSMVARFKREAQMAAGLSHPHIVQIFTVRQTPKIVYFVMKFIEGRGLESVIGDHGALDLEMTRVVLQQAGSALSFAHHRGVVHRDVKPANIMIDENGWAVVTDFGIAKVDDGSNLTATGTTVGTPHYMAPEQFHEKPLTGAADQYALGVVAYEMLTGRKPFNGTTLAEIITQHLFTDPPDIRRDRPDLPQPVSDAIVRMLAKEPQHRFPDLDAAIAGLGQPDPRELDAARGRLMSLARSAPQGAPRLSVPMSPVPVTRPSAPTAVISNAIADAMAVQPPSAGPVPPQTHAGTGRETPAVPDTRENRDASPKKTSRAWLWAVAALIVAAVPATFFGRRVIEARGGDPAERNDNLRHGVELWQQGQPVYASAEFTNAARAMPASALPHVYLARLARESGNLDQALTEAGTAVRLETNNGIALREMGLVLIARRNFEAARAFFVRAIRVNQQDRVAMGWLACSLQRAGRRDQAAQWASRAGSGAWSACVR